MADSEQTPYSLDTISLWNVEALKAFCRRKGLKVSGRREELIARVFAASEQLLPDVLSPTDELKLKSSR